MDCDVHCARPPALEVEVHSFVSSVLEDARGPMSGLRKLGHKLLCQLLDDLHLFTQYLYKNGDVPYLR